jgi:transposase-like protein
MTKAEQTRLWAWRCKVLSAGRSGPRKIAQPCRHFGISRQAFYRWQRRFEAHGEAGLWDRSTRPHRSPRTVQELNRGLSGGRHDVLSQCSAEATDHVARS